ncbi:MAG: exosortase X [Flavobacteriales bacterium]
MEASDRTKDPHGNMSNSSIWRKWWNDRFKRFIVLAVILYLSWYLLYELAIHPWGKLDRLVIENLILLAGLVLKGLGYELIPSPPEDVNIRTIGIDGTHGLWIGDPCNGLTLFALFSIFVIAYPGPIRKKAWFIPLGLLSIHLLNVLRIVALSIIVSYDYAYLDFNHNYTFSIIVYGYVFLLWYLWAGKLAKKKKGKAEKAYPEQKA